MSNPWDPNATPPPGTPPPPPPPPPPYHQPQPPAAQPWGAQPPGPPPGATPPPSSAGGGKGAKVAVGVVGILLLGGAAAFAATSLSGDSGPASPEDAVTEVLEAVDDEDVLGFLGAIDPGERDALLDNIEDIFGELERLDALDSSFEASGIDGVDVTIDFDTVEYDTEQIRDGLVRVEITDGDIEYSAEPSELPVGELITDLQDRFGGDRLDDLDPVEGSTSFSELEEPLFLVARDTGGDGWRVSVGYTIAEYARVDAGEPDLADPIDAIGEDSPEDAVTEFLRALEGDSVDPEELIARLSPSEFGALHEYLPTFLGPDDLRTEAYGDIDVTIDDIEVSADRSGRSAVVTVESIVVTVEETGLDETLVVEWDGECVDLDSDDAPTLEDELEDTPFENEVCADDGIPIGPLALDVERLFRVATAQVDGEWFIAPIDTELRGVISLLEGLDRESIEEGIDYVEDLFDSFFVDVFDSEPSGRVDVSDYGREEAIEDLQAGGLSESQAVCVADAMEDEGIDFEEADRSDPESEIFERVVDISTDCVRDS